MPYKAGNRLGGERAGKLNHLEVINSPLVNRLINEFEKPIHEDSTGESLDWHHYSLDESELKIIFAVDGSLQVIRSELPPYRELSFIKTALIRLDFNAMAELDQESPHPLALRDLLKDSALFHSTVFPLKGVTLPELNTYDAVRKIIFDSFRDESLNAEPFKTLKWLAYKKWSDTPFSSPSFQCPHCEQETKGLPFDHDTGQCSICGKEVFLNDMLGFHLEMSEDATPQSVASAYMLIHETLLLFTGIRYFWEQKKFDLLSQCLFIKDGPLTLRSQYSKLVPQIRDFFEHAKQRNIIIHLIGQEKSGAFVEHLEIISKHAPEQSYFIPNNTYIRKEVQHHPDRGEPYGSRTNYGNKIFVKTDKYHYMVLSIPTGNYKETNSINDLIGGKRILSTLNKLKSYRHEGALMPIQLANGIASLSTYPSAKIFKIFSNDLLK